MSGRTEFTGYAGLLLIAAAALVRLMVPDSGAAALALAVAGAVLLIVYFFRAGRTVQGFLSRRSTREGGGVIGTTLFVLGIAVLVNILAVRFRVTADVTRDRLFSLAPETVTALEQAPEPPRAWVFYPSDDPVRARIQGLMEAARTAVPRFSFRMVDPDRDPMEAVKFDLHHYATVVQVGDRHDLFAGAEERDFLAALLHASRKTPARVAFLRGHGENYFQGRGPESVRTAAEALQNRGYAVEGLSLVEGRTLRDSVDVLVEAGPKAALTAAERDSLRAFLDAGGRLLALLDPANPVTLDSLLAPAGLGFDARFLSDPSRPDPRVLIPAEYSSHPVTRIFRERPLAVVLRGVGEVTTGAGTLPGLRRAAILTSGPRTVVTGDPASVPHSRGLAAAAQWKGTGDRDGRVVVVGDVDFATNSMYEVLGDGDLFLAAVQWLAEEENLIELRPRARTDRPVVIAHQQGRALMVLLVVLLPAAVLAAGGVAWWRRR